MAEAAAADGEGPVRNSALGKTDGAEVSTGTGDEGEGEAEAEGARMEEDERAVGMMEISQGRRFPGPAVDGTDSPEHGALGLRDFGIGALSLRM